MAVYTLQALKDEIVNDPETIGYKVASVWKAHSVIADLVNAVNRPGVDKAIVSAAEIQSAVVAGEFTVLSDANRDLWQAILISGPVRTRDAGIRAQVLAIWGGGTTTRSNLAALQTKTGTRAEELWTDKAKVTPSEVADAEALV